VRGVAGSFGCAVLLPLSSRLDRQPSRQICRGRSFCSQDRIHQVEVLVVPRSNSPLVQSCTAIYVLKRRTVFRNLRRAERHYHCSCPGRNTAPILAFTGEAPEQIQRVQSFYQSRHHRCAVTLIVGYRSCPVDGEGRDDTGPTLATSMGSIRTCE
jgi:hypothetical protein